MQRTYRDLLCQQYPPIATAQALVEAFWRLLQHGAALKRQPSNHQDQDHLDHQLSCCSPMSGDLDAWLAAATASAIPELVSFANGIRRDDDAVAAAFQLPSSHDYVAYCTSSLGW